MQGILIQASRDVQIDGGVVRNCDGEAVRPDSRNGGRHPATSDVTIQNLRVADVRDRPGQTNGIRETGPGTGNSAIRNNDLRDVGTQANLSIYTGSTTVSGNRAGGATGLPDGGADQRWRLVAVDDGSDGGGSDDGDGSDDGFGWWW